MIYYDDMVPNELIEDDSDNSSEIHSGIWCDECKQFPLTVPYVKCEECLDFDLCSSCHAKSKHPHARSRMVNHLQKAAE